MCSQTTMILAATTTRRLLSGAPTLAEAPLYCVWHGNWPAFQMGWATSEQIRSRARNRIPANGKLELLPQFQLARSSSSRNTLLELLHVQGSPMEKRRTKHFWPDLLKRLLGQQSALFWALFPPTTWPHLNGTHCFLSPKLIEIFSLLQTLTSLEQAACKPISSQLSCVGCRRKALPLLPANLPLKTGQALYFGTSFSPSSSSSPSPNTSSNKAPLTSRNLPLLSLETRPRLSGSYATQYCVGASFGKVPQSKQVREQANLRQ